MKTTVLFGLLLWLSASRLFAQETLWPADAGFINVKTSYGARGDGETDDTAAIQRAVSVNLNAGKTLFFPAGTYLVSSRIDWTNASGNWFAFTTWQGEGFDRTIIRLKDNTPAFTNPASPVCVIRPGSEGAAVGGNGGGNRAHKAYIFDLTVHTGSGNAGAVGIDFIASNNGGLFNVGIVSGDGQGVTGLDLVRDVGPCMFRNVYIEGFGFGIHAKADLYGMTFENIYLANQRLAGVYNENNTLAMRGVFSFNTVPAIVNAAGGGMVVVLDSEFHDGAPANPAMDNISSSRSAVLFARNIVTSGYGTAIRNFGTNVSGTTVAEFLSLPTRSLFPSPPYSLNLPIVDTPEFHDNNLTNWANVESYGARKNDALDDAAGIQAAIDSGKSTVYFPWGNYTVNQTVVVRGNVKRIIGFMSQLSSTANPMFRFAAVSNPPVILERIMPSGTIEHASPQPVALKHINRGTYTNHPGSGPWIIEDYCCGQINFINQDVWARQLNVEASNNPQIDNHGSRVWILGLKTEKEYTNLRTRSGGQTELLGALLYPTRNPGATPLFINDNASVSLIYKEMAFATDRRFETQMLEIRNGLTNVMPRSYLVSRGHGGLMPLYVGYHPPITLALSLGGPFRDTVSLGWESVFGQSYALQTSTNLVAWFPITNLTASDTNCLFADPEPLGHGPQKFYRLRQGP